MADLFLGWYVFKRAVTKRFQFFQINFKINFFQYFTRIILKCSSKNEPKLIKMQKKRVKIARNEPISYSGGQFGG